MCPKQAQSLAFHGRGQDREYVAKQIKYDVLAGERLKKNKRKNQNQYDRHMLEYSHELFSVATRRLSQPEGSDSL